MIGNGNVAVDVARMLALTEAELAPTDTTDPAVEAIVGAGIREILMLGRRGPVQAAFTTPELHELGELAGADISVAAAEVELDAAAEAALADDTPIVRRNVDVLREYAAREPSEKPRVVRLRFCVSPVAILGEGRVEAIEVVKNVLVRDAQGRVQAEPTDERELIPCGVVFRSVGYRGVPLPGLPFDDRAGTLPNDGGRVRDADGAVIPGVYCTGWIKRGPSGVIGTNKKDATETVELLLEDARGGLLRARDVGAPSLEILLAERDGDAVMYAGWEAIDAVERALGEPLGRPRVKLCSWAELLAAARGEIDYLHSNA